MSGARVRKSPCSTCFIEELIQIAWELHETAARSEELDITEDEFAFYDALETNDSSILGSELGHWPAT